MLEKPGAQNIIVCENQGKQCELNITENKLKRCFSKKKKKWGWCKKKTKIDWNTSFNKRFYILMVKVIWWNLLNQINVIIYAVKFETFLFDQILKK